MMNYSKGQENNTEAIDIEGGKTADTSILRHRSSHGGSMASSILRFNDVNFVVGKGNKRRNILENVNGKVKWGHVLAVLGPSGAGKTTLISALTLDAFYGKPTGSVTLNGVQLTDRIFKRHCYVVKQHDKHWPYLTARETLTYAAELYDVADKADISRVVTDVITKLGLESCADTRAARLSGGQQRRLSLAIALLKQPTLLFLDEPTSGLDAAAASNIMQEIIRVAREERLIILCTIHQPSTKVYNLFDQVMILSKGREAFAGNVEDAAPYFKSIGYPVPEATNPAEHFLDLVNSDFSSSEEVEHILESWEKRKPDLNRMSSSLHGLRDDESDVTEGVADPSRRSLAREIAIMFRRHTTLIFRDPVLYLGRCFIFLIANMVFAFVYWNGRKFTQDQAVNKLWVTIWFVGVPSNMGVVAVYALNDEFKSILRETKNGMVSAVSYILAKTVLVVPIMFVFAIFALGIPGYVVQDFPASSFGIGIILWAVLIYSFECAAECFAVLFDDPIIGMLQFMNLWFACFLFAGFLIPLDDLYWPFTLFYYILPYGYFVRSFIYTIFVEADWTACTDAATAGAICVNSTNGKDILDAMGRIFPLISSENQVAMDIGIMLGIAMFFKIISVMAILFKTRKVANIEGNHAAPLRRSKLAKKTPESAGKNLTEATRVDVDVDPEIEA